MVHGLKVLGRRVSRPENMILRRPKLHRLLSLRLRARQHNNMTPHRRSKLDRHMSQPPNPHNRHPIRRPNPILSEDSPHRRTRTHQRRRMYRVIPLGNRINAMRIPDSPIAKRPVIKVMETILLLVATVLVPAGCAVIARRADAVRVSESDPVADFDAAHAWAGGFDDADSLMTEDLAGGEVVFVCAAEAGMSGFNEDFVVFEGLGGFVGDDSAFGGAAEDFVCDAHFG